jgi:cytochrome c oxidase cbb3-type subunit 3
MNRNYKATLFLTAMVFAGVLSACNQNTGTAQAPSGAADLARLASVPTNDIAKNPQLLNIAMTEGKRLSDMHCTSCHGADLKGVPDKHTPDLTDNEWMFVGDDTDTGGLVHTPADMEKTITLGIRAMPKVTDQGSQQANDAKNFEIKNLAVMPPFSPTGEYALTEQEIADVAEFTLLLSGQDHNAQMAERGKAVFAEKGSCFDCHDPEGIGSPPIGSTNLTKPALYLYGSSREAILASLKDGRAGVMPAFQGMLKPEEIKAIAVYVFSRGGTGAP